MRVAESVLALELIKEERTEFLKLLQELTAEEWEKPTVCPGWSVKDIALHLLGDDLGVISRERDNFKPELKPGMTEQTPDFASFVEYLNNLNEQWVRGVQRISPTLLCQLLEFSGQQLYQYFASLDPYELTGPVSWAGTQPAPYWLHIAREYTEQWVHQQQIRDAVSKPGLKERRWLYPVLAAFVRALPRTFENVEAKPATVVRLVITGEAGGSWDVRKDEKGWTLWQEADEPLSASVTLDQETAWRLFTKGISKAEALKTAQIEGQPALGEKVLDTVSIIA